MLYFCHQVYPSLYTDTSETILEKALEEFGKHTNFPANRKYVLVTKDASLIKSMRITELLDYEGAQYPSKLKLYIMEEGK